MGFPCISTTRRRKERKKAHQESHAPEREQMHFDERRERRKREEIEAPSPLDSADRKTRGGGCRWPLTEGGKVMERCTDLCKEAIDRSSERRGERRRD
jgi:hypothetical protein